MATHFLLRSPTYVATMDALVVQRRTVVCKYLKENYKVLRGTDDTVYEDITAELSGTKIEINPSVYTTDKVTMRGAYQWLMAKTPQEKAEILGKATSAAQKAINCLIQDEIRCWDDLKLDAVEPAQKPAAPSVPSFDLSTCEAGQTVHAAMQTLSASVQDLLAENERLRQENSELQEHMTEVDQYNALMDEDYGQLEERLRSIAEAEGKIQTLTLEQIAERHPEYPELTVIAQRMKESQGQRAARIQKLTALLPETFSWERDSGLILYQPAFLKALAGVSTEEQQQIVAQIELLAQQGSEYASLHTRKYRVRLPNTPIGCLVSRGADDLRFSWTKNGSITLHWLFRKGDSRVRQSEQ